LVRFSDPERAASATRAAHDPTPHVSAWLNSTLFSTATNVSAPPPTTTNQKDGEAKKVEWTNEEDDREDVRKR